MTQTSPSHKGDRIKAALARVHKSDIPDRGAIALDITFRSGRQSVILTKRGDEVGGFLNRCPHARWPMDTFDGRFLFTPSGELLCAAHSASFDPISGSCLGGPGQVGHLIPVDFVISGEDVEIFDPE